MLPIKFAESITKPESSLYHRAQKVQAPKIAVGEDFRPDGINPSTPDCDTFRASQLQEQSEKEIDCGHDVKKIRGELV